eukprot:4238819-Prymnesium_polylepis.1
MCIPITPYLRGDIGHCRHTSDVESASRRFRISSKPNDSHLPFGSRRSSGITTTWRKSGCPNN